MHKNKDGIFAITPDSLRHEFRTLKGRKEFEAGGVQPDSTVAEPEHSALHNELTRKSMYFKFASRYVSLHHETPEDLDGDSLLGQFHQFLVEQNFSYENEGEQKLKELHDIADKAKYSPAILEEIERIKKHLGEEKISDITKNRTEVLSALKVELMRRYKGEHGRIEASLADDVQLQAAKGLLENRKEYSRRLSMQ